MRCFPQLSSGATGQFPVTRRFRRRTIVNRHADGSAVKLADGRPSVEWHLEYEGLSDAEAQAVADLFRAAEGKLGRFTFLDPCGNLLARSEDPSAAAWTKGASVSLSGGQPDPRGTTRATRLSNAGPASAGIEQRVEAPSGYQYCFSLWARSEQAGELETFQRNEVATVTRAHATGTEWQRLEHTSRLTGPGDFVYFGVKVAAGAAVTLFGTQVEAQPRASSYKKTLAQSGVYPGASFLDDELEIVSISAGWHRLSARVGAQLER